jgi:hypothetical protein
MHKSNIYLGNLIYPNLKYIKYFPVKYSSFGFIFIKLINSAFHKVAIDKINFSIIELEFVPVQRIEIG